MQFARVDIRWQFLVLADRTAWVQAINDRFHRKHGELHQVREFGVMQCANATAPAIRVQSWSSYVHGDKGKPDVVSKIPDFLRRRESVCLHHVA